MRDFYWRKCPLLLLSLDATLNVVSSCSNLYTLGIFLNGGETSVFPEDQDSMVYRGSVPLEELPTREVPGVLMRLIAGNSFIPNCCHTAGVQGSHRDRSAG